METESAALSPARASRRGTLRWLTFLFWVTFCLLIFQLALGFAANSLSLIADSAHSSVDVVSYGLNYVVERLKARAEADARTASTAGEMRAAALVDGVGAALSVLALLAATAFAIVEAWKRLHPDVSDTALPGSADTEEFAHVGSALFAFALVSTVANAAALALYKAWTRDLRSDSSSGPLLETELGTIPDLPADVPAPRMSRGSRKPREGRATPKKGAMNLVASFAGTDDAPGAACQQGCCDYAALAQRNGSAGRQTFSTQGLMQQLHRLVHPGCEGHHEVSPDLWRASQENLNIGAAKLHLVADVFRGITILIAALVIKFSQTADPGKVDAVCALVVAVLIVIGALAIFQKVWVTVRLVFHEP